MAYEVHPLIDDITFITDDKDCCIYIVRGTEHSMLIDLGMSQDPIKPLIDTLINNDYYVVSTHGHIDHVGRSGEFDHLYMSSKDQDVFNDNPNISNYNKFYSSEGLDFIDTSKIREMPAYFDLGDRKIYVVECAGHTPGSVMFVDEKNHTVFSGDAIGSGCSIWLQVDHALTVEQYLYNLKKCYYDLTLLGVTNDWYFLGGHNKHEYYSKISDYNLLNVHSIEDMIQLCERLLQGKLTYRPIHTMTFSTGTPHYTCYKKAEMIFTLEQLKK